jgi:hypothetical protein
MTRLQCGEVYMMQKIQSWPLAIMTIVRYNIDFERICLFLNRVTIGVSSLSGPGGSTFRTYDLETGHLTLEKQLHSPLDGRLHEPQNLGISILRSTHPSANSTPLFALTNGDSVTRLEHETGETVWTWNSPDQGFVLIFTACSPFMMALQVLDLVFSRHRRPINGVCRGTSKVICVLHSARNHIVSDHWRSRRICQYSGEYKRWSI